jgi:glycosyltransferase involved in cell wall biosynthesis
MTTFPCNSSDPSRLRVAIVHYWLHGFGGGERVVEVLAGMFPQADIFAAIANPRTLAPSLRSHRLTTSFLQKIPGSQRFYKYLLPLHPLALENLDLSGYDLILSSESGPAKGVLSSPKSCHICYCHTPMRYIWDMYHDYRSSLPVGVRSIFSLAAHYMRIWDITSASRVDYFVANSYNVASRIRKCYRRDSVVIHPPVGMPDLCVPDRIDDYYLVVSRLTHYKRVDVAIEACERLGRRLRIVGDGDQYKYLRRMAGSGIEFLGFLRDEEVREQYSHCRALLFPGDEDFGMAPVEAQSFGRPVIALGKGGALETVVGLSQNDSSGLDTATGVFFSEQNWEKMAEAIQYFESIEERFDPRFIQESVQRFSPSRFRSEMFDFIDRALLEHHGLSGPEGSGKRQGVSISVREKVI